MLTPRQNWLMSPQEFAFEEDVVKQTFEGRGIRTALTKR